ncbi:hypothetical protein [Flavobacterium ajazii]|uniref:hypothetical protein n=1 Tax=Flavobacterium ajazii TaxID=2692318 RepID=UPI0013D3C5C7|nr:hypothetical protein [Flavobacterium ajazii]
MSISIFIFSLNSKELIIKNEGLIFNYKKSKKNKDFNFQEIQSINVIHKDYYIFQTKSIELKFYSNEKTYKINCNGIIEKDEYEDEIYLLYIFLKEKFQNTYFIEFDLLRFSLGNFKR